MAVLRLIWKNIQLLLLARSFHFLAKSKHIWPECFGLAYWTLWPTDKCCRIRQLRRFQNRCKKPWNVILRYMTCRRFEIFFKTYPNFCEINDFRNYRSVPLVIQISQSTRSGNYEIRSTHFISLLIDSRIVKLAQPFHHNIKLLRSIRSPQLDPKLIRAEDFTDNDFEHITFLDFGWQFLLTEWFLNGLW